MILVDTSVWIALFRKVPEVLAPGLALLRRGGAVIHPWTLLELRLGHGVPGSYLRLLRGAPSVRSRPESDLLGLLEDHALAGTGIGVVDLQLLATAAHENLPLWTRDRALADAGVAIGLPATTP